jgi:hypothetical protein
LVTSSAGIFHGLLIQSRRGMDISELRGWAAFMDKAAMASLIVTIAAAATLGITTWLSSRFSNAVRTHEQAVFDRYRGMEGERVSTLEQQVTAARERAATLEREASAARDRAEAFGQAAREANDRAARADRETAAASAKERAAELDAAEIRQRLAELGTRVREATERAPDPVKEAPPIVASLHKYAGTKAAIFVVDQVFDAPAAGAAISGSLSDAGWAAQTWKWTGVAGISGVVVLVRDGSDSATDEAASALVEQLRASGFSASKADWPGNWRRFRGLLDGPQTPDPTEAAIRIVIGVKPR